MRRPLAWLQSLLDDVGNPPVFCAGDIFDRWNPPPELINFAIDHLPGMWAVAGNHDLPGHNLSSIHRSGYHTLAQAGVIQHMGSGACYKFGPPVASTGPKQFASRQLLAMGYSWGQRPAMADAHNLHDSPIKLAISHRYVHNGGNTTYVGSADDDKATGVAADYGAFTHAHFGDNHIPFDRWCCGTHMINTGGFYRRTVAEADHRPGVVLLYADGVVERVTYDTHKEAFDDTAPMVSRVSSGVEDFITSLAGVDTSRGYDGLVRRWLEDNEVSPNIEELIRQYTVMTED